MAKKLTVQASLDDFKAAYRAKRKLIERQKEDFLFALGEQWNDKDKEILTKAGVKPITDNRIAPNIYLLTGLERQNRSDFKAFPEGEEDTLKSEIASALFKDTIKKSDFSYKSSDQFKDGITCGESHLELYLDYTDNLINGKPCWRKLDSNVIFPEPGFSEYDFRDAKYVYKIVLGVSREDLINIYPDKKRVLELATSAKLDFEAILGGDDTHVQKRTYSNAKEGSDSATGDDNDDTFDLIERYYKKWVQHFFIGDQKTGEIQEAESQEKAEAFIQDYQNRIVQDQQGYQQAIQGLLGQHMAQMGPEAAMVPPEQHLQMLNEQGVLPPPPPEQDPNRYIIIKKLVPEMWCFAHVPGIDKPLADERAWFYPKWKLYPFVPYFARFSTAPLKGEERHLLVQGIVHGVKGVQEKHNKAEMLMLRHLNTSANSGWDIEDGQVENEDELRTLGSAPGVVIKRKKGTPPLQRLIPVPLSQGHAALSAESAEAIKAQLGINADLLATQQGGSDSGRAIALRQRQGLLMVQELFDNLTRSRVIAGRFLLSQLGEIYDTESSKKVLGDAFLIKNFPPPMMADENGQIDPMSGQPQMAPMIDPETGKPMQYDKQMAELAIAEVLKGDLAKYDVAVGEAVSSETQRMANSAEIREIAQSYPGLIPPDILVEESQLPQATKTKVLKAMQAAQEQAAMMAQITPKKPSPGMGDTGGDQAA